MIISASSKMEIEAHQHLSNAETLGQLANAVAFAVVPSGIDAFAIGNVPLLDKNKPGDIFLSRWSNWLDYYAVNGFVHDDIVVHECRRSTAAFTWTELKARRPGEGLRVLTACQEFGWNDGLLVPILAPDSSRGFVSLVTRLPVLTLTPAERGRLIKISTAAYRTAAKLAIDEKGSSMRLSGREQEALTYVAQGKDDAEIASIMAVSRSTAHAHVERAKRRLGATTRAQAVAMAIMAKLI